MSPSEWKSLDSNSDHLCRFILNHAHMVLMINKIPLIWLTTLANGIYILKSAFLITQSWDQRVLCTIIWSGISPSQISLGFYYCKLQIVGKGCWHLHWHIPSNVHSGWVLSRLLPACAFDVVGECWRVLHVERGKWGKVGICGWVVVMTRFAFMSSWWVWLVGRCSHNDRGVVNVGVFVGGWV
jgi:hypothetical protein